MDKGELFFPKEKHLGKMIIILSLIVVILGGGYYYYKAIYTNPASIAEDTFKKINDIITSKAQNINTDNPLELNGLISIKLNDSSKKDVSEIISNSDFQLNIKLDEKQKAYAITLNSKYDNNNLINIDSYIENGTIYYKSNDIYDEYVNVKDNYSIITKLEFMNTLKKLINTIKDTSITQKWQRVKEDSLINNFLELKDNDAKLYINNILNTLKNDQNFLVQIKKINSHFDEKLDEYIDKISNDTLNYKLSIYTENNLKQNITKIEQKINNSIIIIEFIDNNNFTITLKDDEKTNIINLTLSDKVINININSNRKDDNILIDAKFNYDNIKTFTKEEINNAKKKEELTDEEKNIITEKLQEKREIKILYDELKNLLYNKKM